MPAETRGVPVERLAAATDFLVVMAYDLHASNDNPGPIATPSFVAESAAGYLRRAPADHIVVALGAYGYDWPLDGQHYGPSDKPKLPLHVTSPKGLNFDPTRVEPGDALSPPQPGVGGALGAV